MSSSYLVRWIKRSLAFLAVGQILALAVGGTVTVLGTPAGDAERAQHVAAQDEPTPPPGSSSSSSSTGESPPAVTPAIGGTLGTHDWYVDDVTLTWETHDDETPVSSTDGCDPQSITTDTTGTAFACTATSDGGSTTVTVTIARDATTPHDVSVAADRAPDNGTWYTAPFTATWSGSDDTSGIASCESTTYSGPDDAAGVLDGTCTDWAGNAGANAPFAFAYDATAPAVTGTPDRSADHGGWYNHALTVTWSSDDPDATCDAPTTYSGPDAASVSVNGHCADPAGNIGTGSFTFAYDATGPTITLTTPADGASYVLHQPVDADYTCSDATSTVDTCAGTVANGAAIDTTAVGTKAFVVDATDQAGNTAHAEASYSVIYSPVGVACGGVAGHQILQPIAANGSSVFKQGSTVPAKFRVCDWYGEPVSTPGVVTSFWIVSPARRSVPSTSAHDAWRSGNAQWIFNISTKSLDAGQTYGFEIGLDDGSTIPFGFAVR